MRLLRKNAFLIVAGLALVLSSVSALAATQYFQGFETDTYDWTGATRVGSGSNGVASATGNFHAEAVMVAAPGSTLDFTRFGGYESVFPAGGYTTSVDVYLNVTAGNANDTRFDWSSAINTPAGTHRRDFVFNAGFYLDSDATGTGPRFVISASNNATRGGAFPKNPARDPFTITQTGWYTFEHHFRNDGSGVLAVDLTISALGGPPLHSWTLTNPTDVIGSTVGGHRYGWFTIQEFPVLAFDNVSLVSVNEPTNAGDCKNDGWQSRTRADGSSFKNQGDCIQYVNTGK
ncbi:MAG TPA: hypothetical protein VFX97_03450 [Pyrinomonadaceae bacterium]|nr:hypothetical protein [Pyrinomonadaceae bacterium]